MLNSTHHCNIVCASSMTIKRSLGRFDNITILLFWSPNKFSGLENTNVNFPSSISTFSFSSLPIYVALKPIAFRKITCSFIIETNGEITTTTELSSSNTNGAAWYHKDFPLLVFVYKNMSFFSVTAVKDFF